MTDDVQVTVAEAAAQVGMRPVTIYRWVAEGALIPIPGTAPMRFWLSDVFAAEAGRKRQMRRTSTRGTFTA